MSAYNKSIEELNDKDIPRNFLFSFNRAYFSGDSLGCLLDLCQKYEKACFQTKQYDSQEFFRYAKNKNLFDLLGRQRIFVSVDFKSNLNTRNVIYYLTVENNRDY